MVIFLNQFFLLVSIFSLLFLFFALSVFHIVSSVSMTGYNSSSKFFNMVQTDYYELNDYLEQQPPLREQLDQETNAPIINSEPTNLRQFQYTSGKYTKLAEATITNYVSENQHDDDIINFIAAGDWSCNKETKKTVKKIKKLDPELVLGLGDYTFESISPQCWFDISKPIDEKMKIAIGNHDLDYQISYNRLLDHYSLQEPYYSFDFYNIHFLAISSEHPFKNGSKQYEFIKKDLEESIKDLSILWRIVFLHKPMYNSADFDRKYSEQLKNTFHQLFEKYRIDLVLSGHTQYYQRSLPLSYNNYNTTNPFVIDQNNTKYTKDGVIFITAGTAGDKLHHIGYYLPYYKIQKEKFGFLNFNLENYGHRLIGTFYDTDDLDILDRFIIYKDNENRKIITSSEKEVESF